MTEKTSTEFEVLRVPQVELLRQNRHAQWIYKEQWRDRWHFQRDTIDRVRVDSVAVEREKIVEVEKPLSKWQSLKIRAFPWLLGLLSAAGLWALRKPILKLITK